MPLVPDNIMFDSIEFKVAVRIGWWCWLLLPVEYPEIRFRIREM